jgi:hypothetical protein
VAEISELEVEQLLYAVGLRHPGGTGLAPHGTPGAYQRHLRNHDEPCDACRRANSEAKREQRHNPPAPSGRRKPIAHGTYKGAQQHRYRGEKPCDACRLAANAYQNERNAAKKERP